MTDLITSVIQELQFQSEMFELSGRPAGRSHHRPATVPKQNDRHPSIV